MLPALLSTLAILGTMSAPVLAYPFVKAPQAADSSSVSSSASSSVAETPKLSWVGSVTLFQNNETGVSSFEFSPSKPSWLTVSDFVDLESSYPILSFSSSSSFVVLLDDQPIISFNNPSTKVFVITTCNLSLATYANAFDYGGVVSNIGDGLDIIGGLGSNINGGFTGLFYNHGELTDIGTFSFVLLGLGMAVGCITLCKNWITSRHGM